MSCIVCMDDISNCNLICGHSFCRTCVKEWYMKGNSTCPMCRTNICFRGFTHSVNKWQQEKEDQKFQCVFADAVDHILIEEESEDGTESYESDSEYIEEHSPEPRIGEEDEWSDSDSDFEFELDYNLFVNPPNKIQQLIDMEKKFNRFKDEYDPEDLLEIIVHPYYVLCKSNNMFEYENYNIKNEIIPKYSPIKLTGLSHKCRRQVQTHGDAPYLLQLLLGQFFVLA